LFFKQSAVASGGAVNEVAKAEKAKKTSHAESELANLQFVQLDPMVLPIIDGDGVQQVVTLVVVIEVESDSAVQQVKKLSPRLKDAFIQDMYGVLNRKTSMEGGVVRVDRLKSRLTKVSTKVLGKENVSQVLLQVVQQNPV
jgi:flagellar FliL protein